MLQQKQKDYNWYYAQCFVRVEGEVYSRYLNCVVFARTPELAKQEVMKYFEEQYKGKNIPASLSINDIHLYQKNYIRKSRAMVAAGQYCGSKPLGV